MDAGLTLRGELTVCVAQPCQQPDPLLPRRLQLSIDERRIYMGILLRLQIFSPLLVQTAAHGDFCRELHYRAGTRAVKLARRGERLNADAEPDLTASLHCGKHKDGSEVLAGDGE